MKTLKKHIIGGIKITKISLFLAALIVALIASVTFSGCVEEKPDVIIVEVPANNNNGSDQGIVCETDNADNENCNTYQPNTVGEVPEITGTVERYGDTQYKITLYIRNTLKGDFVYKHVRTELDNDQEEYKRDIIYGSYDYAKPIVISKNNVRKEIIYTASLSDKAKIEYLKNIKDSGEMTLRVAFDMDGPDGRKEQCSLDATLPDYDNLNGRRDLQITEVRNINDD